MGCGVIMTVTDTKEWLQMDKNKIVTFEKVDSKKAMSKIPQGNIKAKVTTINQGLEKKQQNEGQKGKIFVKGSQNQNKEVVKNVEKKQAQLVKIKQKQSKVDEEHKQRIIKQNQKEIKIIPEQEKIKKQKNDLVDSAPNNLKTSKPSEKDKKIEKTISIKDFKSSKGDLKSAPIPKSQSKNGKLNDANGQIKVDDKSKNVQLIQKQQQSLIKQDSKILKQPLKTEQPSIAPLPLNQNSAQNKQKPKDKQSSRPDIVANGQTATVMLIKQKQSKIQTQIANTSLPIDKSKSQKQNIQIAKNTTANEQVPIQKVSVNIAPKSQTPVIALNEKRQLVQLQVVKQESPQTLKTASEFKKTTVDKAAPMKKTDSNIKVNKEMKTSKAMIPVESVFLHDDLITGGKKQKISSKQNLQKIETGVSQLPAELTKRSDLSIKDRIQAKKTFQATNKSIKPNPLSETKNDLRLKVQKQKKQQQKRKAQQLKRSQQQKKKWMEQQKKKLNVQSNKLKKVYNI